jgi:sterol desaturase/sphingolipid hydroxylase (fatty acid hydroxylase superfamily)
MAAVPDGVIGHPTPGPKGRPIDALDLASIPIFVTTMIAEAAVLRRRSQRNGADDRGVNTDEVLGPHDLPPDRLIPIGYERRDTVASLSMLLGNVAINLAAAGAIGKLNHAVFSRRIADIGTRRGSLAIAIVAWDFLYYWDHRWMHEVRLFWANHVSHHSGQRYNLSTALRQPWSGFLLSWVYLPMPLLGIPAHHVIRAGQLNLLYQYWIHTEAIDRLPRPIEALFNTPSHHRVHHGADQQYLDRNYGGVLIVWDRLFGTFEPEIRRVTYGLTKNIDTYNPLRIGYHEFVDIGRDVIAVKGLRNKLRHVFGRPGWTPSPATRAQLDAA